MGCKLIGSNHKRTLSGSHSFLKYLSVTLFIFGLLSGCSTKVGTDGTGAQLAPVDPNAPIPQTVPLPNGSSGGTYSPPIANNGLPPNLFNNNTTTPTYPNYNYTTTLNCYLQRSGGYYFANQPVIWQFASETGEALEVVWIDTGEAWTSSPQYPIAPRFSISFYSQGTRQLSFYVRSSANPNRYCNSGQPITDTVYINPGNYYY